MGCSRFRVEGLSDAKDEHDHDTDDHDRMRHAQVHKPCSHVPHEINAVLQVPKMFLGAHFSVSQKMPRRGAGKLSPLPVV